MPPIPCPWPGMLFIRDQVALRGTSLKGLRIDFKENISVMQYLTVFENSAQGRHWRGNTMGQSSGIKGLVLPILSFSLHGPPASGRSRLIPMNSSSAAGRLNAPMPGSAAPWISLWRQHSILCNPGLLEWTWSWYEILKMMWVGMTRCNHWNQTTTAPLGKA